MDAKLASMVVVFFLAVHGGGNGSYWEFTGTA